MQSQNLFANLPDTWPDERFDDLVRGGEFKLERIVSTGQSTPEGQWYDQEFDEWVLLLRGSAVLRFDDESDEIVMQPGDYLQIPAHRRHRVGWTDPTQPTVWLAIHYRPMD